MKINTPVNSTIKTADGSMNLIWKPNFAQIWDSRYSMAQKFVDSEVIRLCGPYTPFETGMLQNSALSGTTIGTGEVIWNSPYAQFLYYGHVMISPSTGSTWAKKGERKVLTDRSLKYNGAPKRGKLWFERMKADHREHIIRGAAKIAGGGIS